MNINYSDVYNYYEKEINRLVDIQEQCQYEFLIYLIEDNLKDEYNFLSIVTITQLVNDCLNGFDWKYYMNIALMHAMRIDDEY